MRFIISFFLLSSIFVNSQTRFIASYECKTSLNFSNFKIDFSKNIKLTGDSASMEIVDTAFKEFSDSNFLKQMFNRMFGDTTVIYYRVEADPSSAVLEGNSGNQVNIDTKMKYENNDWKNFNSKTNKYEKPDS